MNANTKNKSNMQSIQTRLEIPSKDGYLIPGVLHSSTGDINKIKNKNITIMLHGIFSNKDESGRFIRLADKLVAKGCDVIRIDYRGHGDHPVEDKQATINGMLVDIHSTLAYIQEKTPSKIFAIASSFGGSLLLLYLQTIIAIKLERVVLFNPVIDYISNFLQAKHEWGQRLFNEKSYKELESRGYITLEENFQMSLAMVIEMNIYQPYKTFKTLTIPTLVMHGDKDSAVPYLATKNTVQKSQHVKFHTISGADHAFKTQTYEKITHDLAVDWIC